MKASGVSGAAQASGICTAAKAKAAADNH